jgi:hypothetical protein
VVNRISMNITKRVLAIATMERYVFTGSAYITIHHLFLGFPSLYIMTLRS